MRIFNSHSSINSDAAEKLCAMLEERGFSCFIAPRDIRSGYEYAEEIVNGIDDSDLMVLLLSKDSNTSPHVLREVERAVSKKKSIIVYKLEEVTLTKSLEYFLMTHQWVNTKPGSNFDEIISSVSEYADRHNGQNGDSGQPDQASAPLAANKTKRRSAAFPIAAAAVFLAVTAGIITLILSKNHDDLPVINNSAQSADSDNSMPGSGTPVSDEASAPTGSEVISQPQPGSGTPASGDVSPAEGSETTPQSQPGSGTPASGGVSPAEGSEVISQLQPGSGTPASSEVSPSEGSEITSQSQPEKPSPAAVTPGERITLGTYNGEPIEWRVIHISEDKTRAVVISDKILTMKAFDAAEGGSFNEMGSQSYWTTRSADIDPDTQRMIRGDNRWDRSNIRAWLNSEKENVKYEDQAPASTAMSEKRNGYHTEAGFLNEFTEEELSAIAVSDVTTDGVDTKDKVFLLSEEELKWLEEADVSIYTEPTEAAVAQDKSEWYKVDVSAYNTEDFIWWLREPNTDTACECMCVNLSCFEQTLRLNSNYAGLEGYGIRPAMTLDLTSDKMISLLEN